MPIVNKTFNQLIDFTRTSAATYVDATGRIVPTAASRNLLTFTQEFDNAGWVKTAATVYPFDPATASYGPELITNGDFSGGTTGWTGSGSGGWLISGGVATHTAGTYGTLLTSYASTTTTGKVYVLTFDFAGTGGLNIYSRNALLGVVSGTGAKRIFFTAAATSGATLNFEDVAFNGTIDNISLKEVIGGLIAAPDGTFTADTLVDDTTSSQHRLNQSGVNLTSGVPYAVSLYAKAGTHNFIQLLVTAGSGTNAWFTVIANLATGAITQTGNGTSGTLTASSITSVGNGWYRIAMTGSAAGTSAFRIAMVPAASGNSISATDGTVTYTGAGTSLFIWGAQLEAVPDANLVLGSERVTNGGFADATGWSTSTGWAISGGQATFTANSGNWSISSVATSAATAGKTYRIEYTVVANTLNAGNLRVGGFSGNSFFGGTLANIPTTVGTNVAYITVATPSGTGTVLDFWVSNAATSGAISIDNISVKEITGTTGMPTDYTRNVGGVYPPRFDYDPVTLAPKGLLVEEQRTNLLLRSEEFDNASWTKANPGVAVLPVVTANAGISPDGTMDADRVQFDCGDNTSQTNRSTLTQTLTVSSGTAYRGSLYIKAYDAGNVGKTVRITSDNIGTTVATLTADWKRVEWGGTAASTPSNVVIECRGTYTTQTADVLIWGAQLEAGSFATSYIPTVASQVTRTADVATITGANFSQWYNQSEGTFVVEVNTPTAASYNSVVVVDDGTSNNVIAIGQTTSGLADYTVQVGGAVSASFQATTIAGTRSKMAAAYALDNFARSIGGGTVSTDTSGTVPAVTAMRIGNGLGSRGYLNGHIRSIRYYPTRLQNSQLQALTA